MERKTVKSSAAQAREERRKAALRANLQRRKAQARARSATQDDVDGINEEKES